ncbi:unnamed protein product [Prunus armeniaca]|uniref:Uncharacterized protein n=1 Tax=Prunus armeniaca TaxID=36596 RepID=A0A6J5TVY0_PRUAR|nr:unnamed protein product [Prunus armeniaca]
MKPVFRVADGAPFQGSVMRLHISRHHEWCLFFQCLITSPTVTNNGVSNGGDDGLKKFQGSREARSMRVDIPLIAGGDIFSRQTPSSHFNDSDGLNMQELMFPKFFCSRSKMTDLKCS